ncbi:hypothetical protein [uncultured Stenotrophomonas sp.]|uniref:hypothetical protein n=1 Tax=uncultured Stenotrophomonas sp. TaxID=165438 RepID=UPI0025F2C526|nr:hypothetical protein [uncultured Stenotrophomonas sp.]
MALISTVAIPLIASTPFIYFVSDPLKAFSRRASTGEQRAAVLADAVQWAAMPLMFPFCTTPCPHRAGAGADQGEGQVQGEYGPGGRYSFMWCTQALK